MANPFIGEIRIFAGKFEPYGWFFCNGQQLIAQQYETLYAIIGNTYGGTPNVNFNLPNLQAYAPMGQGAGPGLTERTLGEPVGEPAVTVTQNQMPSHNHTAQATAQQADSADPTNRYWARTSGANMYSTINDKLVQMNIGALGVAGASLPHNNMQPFLGINFIIAWQGDFPVRQ